jgi:hypothetical protein
MLVTPTHTEHRRAMSNRASQVTISCRALAPTLVCLVAIAVLPGCSGTSPEHKQALAKVQDLGGRVNIKRGGYEVDFTRTAVEDKDLANLKHIANLKNVDLQGTRVSDEGIVHLREIATLEMVDLRRTNVTGEAVADLRKALPKANIEH